MGAAVVAGLYFLAVIILVPLLLLAGIIYLIAYAVTYAFHHRR